MGEGKAGPSTADQGAAAESPADWADGVRITLAGRIALITGAATGIGAATARLLHRAGASLILCDRAEGPELALDSRGRRLSRVLDVRDHGAVDALVDDAVQQFGHIDILVNNAGGTFPSPMLDVSDNGEAALMAENFTQLTHLIRRVVPVMPDGGAIVNLTSIEAHQAAPGFAIYAAMKAAVENLTRTMALELAPRRIRVNAIAPDALASEGETSTRQSFLAGPVPYDPTFVPPLGYVGTPDDGANAVLFLVSSMARFITGTTLHVDGGNHAAGGWRYRPPEEPSG